MKEDVAAYNVKAIIFKQTYLHIYMQFYMESRMNITEV